MSIINIGIRFDVTSEIVINIIIYAMFERKGLDITEEVVFNLTKESVKASGYPWVKNLHKDYLNREEFPFIEKKANQLARVLFSSLFSQESNASLYINELEYKLGG